MVSPFGLLWFGCNWAEMLLGWFGLDLNGSVWFRRGVILVALGGGGKNGAPAPHHQLNATRRTRNGGGVDEARADGQCARAGGSARYGDPPPLLPFLTSSLANASVLVRFMRLRALLFCCPGAICWTSRRCSLRRRVPSSM